MYTHCKEGYGDWMARLVPFTFKHIYTIIITLFRFCCSCIYFLKQFNLSWRVVLCGCIFKYNFDLFDSLAVVVSQKTRT